MTHCWARVIGGCSAKISREHLVTEALWEGPTIRVVGLPWCKTEPKTIGLSGLTSKILCRAHNSQLSDVDAVGASAFKTLRAASQLGEVRRKLRPRHWKVRRFEIDGRRLERWFLKTLINLVVSSAPAYCWALNRTPLDEPPEQLVRAVYGLEQLVKPVGLYAVGTVGEKIESGDVVEVSTLLRGPEELVGAVVGFLGFRFLIYADSRPLPDTLALPKGRDWLTTDLLYHMDRFNHKVGRKLSHYVHYLWNLS